MAIEEDTDILGYIKNLPEKPYCILIDEAQFLKRHHVYDLARVVDELDVPVMAFGLKNDFRNELFEGSKHLLLLADKIDQDYLPILFTKSNYGFANRSRQTSVWRGTDSNRW